MAFIPRIFVDPAALRDGTVFVTGVDANHVRNVLRIPVGGKITVCDGARTVYPGEILSYSPDGFLARVGEGQTDTGELPARITVYQCYPKGEKTDLVVQKSVELGAAEIVFVLSERCVARPDGKAMEKKRERLQKIAEAAAAQSGRSVVPTVRGLLSYTDACKEAAEADCAFLCYEGGGTLPLREILESHPNAERIAFLIGPEGGISPAEAEEAGRAGLALANLGSRILRTETAPLFVLSACNVLL